MVFLDVALVGLVVGKLLGGRFVALGDTKIAATWLVFVAIGLQMVAFPWSFLPWTTPTSLARAIWLVSFALLVLMLVLNRALRGTMIIAGGLACNLVAVVANHGLMPVLPGALRVAGTHYHVHNNSIQVVQPHLGFLVDRWGAPQWLPLANVFSVGDVLIAAGTIVAIAAAMRAPARTDGAADHGEEIANGGGSNRPTQLVSSPRVLPSATN
jgi:Family of unknown function (DUF5317)